MSKRGVTLIIWEAGLFRLTVEGTVEELIPPLRPLARDGAWLIAQSKLEVPKAVDLSAISEGRIPRRFEVGKYFPLNMVQNANVRTDVEFILAHIRPLKPYLVRRRRIPSAKVFEVIARVKASFPDRAPLSPRSVSRYARAWADDDFSYRPLVTKSYGCSRARFPMIVIGICWALVDTYYLKHGQRSIDTVHARAEWVIKVVGEVTGGELGECPSARTLARMASSRGALVNVGARLSKKLQKQLAIGTGLAPPLFRLGQRVELDHHQMKIFVVDDRTGREIGKPWLTLAIEALTRCIVGFWITMRDPASESVKRCLEMSCYPKADMSPSDLPLKHPWIHSVVPEFLVMDNGPPLRGLQIEDLADGVGFITCFPPAYKPWFRGVVERMFRTQISGLISTLPGFAHGQSVYIRDSDPAGRAVLTVSQLSLLFRKWAVDIYHHRPHRGLFGYTPAQVWDQLAAAQGAPLPADELKRPLFQGHWERRRLTAAGIAMECLQYNDSNLAALRTEIGTTSTVESCVSYGDVSRGFVIHPNTGAFIPMRCVDLAYSEGLSLYAHTFLRATRKAPSPSTNDRLSIASDQAALEKFAASSAKSNTRRSRRKAAAVMEERRVPESAPSAEPRSSSRTAPAASMWARKR